MFRILTNADQNLRGLEVQESYNAHFYTLFYFTPIHIIHQFYEVSLFIVVIFELIMFFRKKN
jgi:hypothetical protein